MFFNVVYKPIKQPSLLCRSTLIYLDGFITSGALGDARRCSAEVRPLESFDPPPRPLQFLLEESADGRSL